MMGHGHSLAIVIIITKGKFKSEILLVTKWMSYALYYLRQEERVKKKLKLYTLNLYNSSNQCQPNKFNENVFKKLDL